MIRPAILIALAFFLLLNTSCKHHVSAYSKKDIEGSWYLNKWKPYNSLVFSDSTVFVGNSTDTVFTLNYTLSHDSLITWSAESKGKYAHKILTLDKDELQLEGIHTNAEVLKYSRTKTDYK
jgi:hypothetical protein